MATAEWELGIFTMMAVMAAIIGGGTGVRLVYIDEGYRRIINSMVRELRPTGSTRRRVRSPAGMHVRKTPRTGISHERRLKREEALSDMRGKRDANRRGVVADGIWMVAILVVGLVTALGFSPDLLASVAVALICLLSAVVSFQYHAQNVLKERS